ncbi:NAD(P)H-dependent glycerol-3-phosphate dehydrogenase [Opitutales bacterium ASA1]|uniref:NAD(P)H-dependent glycerol-3-phosphate dehydrogenase n=1 Tax=Congregicoccus parvus TaxID=3081749 RepID=UPI002B310BAE|nr:NAD(P)H-dependent glycerol-3-phosphate dehydrogenase [Opitutales bacterium ASA1]
MNICVFGAGAWGTALALHLVRLGHTVTLVPRRFEAALELGSTRENRDYLPGTTFPDSLQIGFEVAPVLMECEMLVLACPMAGLRGWCDRVRPALAEARRLGLVVSLAKGLEPGTHHTPSRIVEDLLPGVRVAALTGPSHAAEVASGHPTALVLATHGHSTAADEAQAALSGPGLRVYTSDDLRGAELGGALKNVYAIAAGICDGLALGDNAKAALVTRIIAEVVRIGDILGARPRTFMGLSGVGDLVATCYGPWSRNREFGQGVGAGRSVAELLAGRKTVVEGYRTTESLWSLCREHAIEAPILEEIHAILYAGRSPREGLAALMGRGLKRESAS